MTNKLTPEGLEAIGQAIFGSQWQRELARHLSFGDRTLRRYLDGSRGMPDWLPNELRALAAARTAEIQDAVARLLPEPQDVTRPKTENRKAAARR